MSTNGAFFEYNYRETERDFQALVRSYRELPAHLMRTHMRQAVARAITPFKSALRAAAPVKTGGLRKSVQSKVKFYSRTYPSVVGVVGFARNKARGQLGYQAALIEQGTAERTRKNGGRTGRLTPHPILRPVLAANRSAILANVMREMAVGLEKAAAQLGKGS